MKKPENKIMLITYPDSMGNNLKDLDRILDKYFEGAVDGVHILSLIHIYISLLCLCRGTGKCRSHRLRSQHIRLISSWGQKTSSGIRPGTLRY